jgi:hypothetical protein
VVQLLDSGRVGLHHLPALAVVQLHPIVLAILNLAGALEGLREQLTEVVVIGRVFEAKVPYVTEIFVELLYVILVMVLQGLEGNEPG